ncbi:putative leader peptide [Streptomyces sp. NPDC007905]|uniref:putative leader peptide n=1 Tax=Streptomyces sp. NPDC007905 TaxID=3364788 RepID=UPI0036E4797B
MTDRTGTPERWGVPAGERSWLAHPAGAPARRHLGGGNIRGRPGVPRHDEIRQADADQARRARRREVPAVTHALPLRVPHAYRSVRLHSRPHIDLQRVAGALCRH